MLCVRDIQSYVARGVDSQAWSGGVDHHVHTTAMRNVSLGDFVIVGTSQSVFTQS